MSSNGEDEITKRIEEATGMVDKVNEKLVYYQRVEETLKAVLKEVRNYSKPNRAFGSIQEKEAYVLRSNLRNKIERILVVKELPL